MVINKLIFVLVLTSIILLSCSNIDNSQTDNDIINQETLTCEVNEDCVPKGCCHPDSCVNQDYKSDCFRIACSENCAPDSLDCGQGSCQCINNQCEAVFNE
jgi:hypothetical protein|tara:strand:- start:827 stop:1129 length:303 start_codon:yes stop_codon:yes gene_type:complete